MPVEKCAHCGDANASYIEELEDYYCISCSGEIEEKSILLDDMTEQLSIVVSEIRGSYPLEIEGEGFNDTLRAALELAIESSSVI